MSVPYASHPTSFQPYSSWEWNDPWATPEHAAPREPVRAGQPHVVNDCFVSKNWSRVHEYKKVVKQIYVVKKDGRKNISLDLNSIGKKPINALKTSAIDGKERGKLDPPSAKSERRS